MPIANGVTACPNCEHPLPETPLADRLAIIVILVVIALVVVASAARVGFAVAGSVGLWIGTALGGLAVWAGVDRVRQDRS